MCNFLMGPASIVSLSGAVGAAALDPKPEPEYKDVADKKSLAPQAASELRKLATRTAGAVGAAAQSAVTRQQMGELLHFASGARAAASEPLVHAGCAPRARMD